MSTRLAPCPSCGRHVRAGEPSCPFCASVLPERFRPPQRPLVVAAGPFARAAILFMGATACGGSVASSGGAVPFYGPAVIEDAGADADADAAPNPVPLPFYGPAMVDAGEETQDAAADGAEDAK